MSPAAPTTNAVPATPDLADQAAPLDALLVEPGRSLAGRFLPDSSTATWAWHLAQRPGTTLKRLTDLGTETAKIAVGASDLAPDRKDRRFADEAWAGNPLLKRAVQLYLAAGSTASHLVQDADLDWRDRMRVEFLVDNLNDLLSPSNLPLVNPASAKEALNTGGESLVRGGTQLLKDLVAAPRIPEMVDSRGFEVGANIAATPGAVVFRNEVFELISYAPQTEDVHVVPVLVVPPTINKFYAIDLAPGRSLIEFSVREGRQMFVMSWRNPDARHAAWNIETYAEAIITALDVVEEISGSPQSVLAGICSGGILASMTAAYLAQTGRQDRIAAFLLAVTVIDNRRAGMAGALTDPEVARVAKARSKRRGFVDGRELAEVFAWLRPRDLIWNYWVNNYLLGKRPPAFDILFWNSDTTRMPAALHSDFVDLSLSNALVHPGEQTLFGLPIDLRSITVDSYIVAGVADHITPWESCYGTTQLLGGKTRFVLSNSGHIAALVNPPGNPKAAFQVAADNPPTAGAWRAQATTQQGTWWADITQWLADRFPETKPAPAAVGSAQHPALEAAPGTYVYDS